MQWFANKGQVLQIGLQIAGIVGGATVIATLTAGVQKFREVAQDWWIIGSVFIGSLLVMWWTQTIGNKRPLDSRLGITAHPLRPNQIIYPASKNGVLWEWVPGVGLSGPFCPTHRVNLLYWPVHGVEGKTPQFKEENYLSGSGSFVCPIDEEEFIFIRLAGAMKIGGLRAQAMAQFQAENDRRKLSGA